MTREETIKILDPETSRNALLRYKEGEQRLEACNEACRIAASALRAQQITENMSPKRLLEILQAEKDGRLVVLPCRVGDEVFVDVRTLPYHYLHPEDECRDYAKCEIVSIVTIKKETYMKLRALYPSRACRREYLRYGVAAIGKTVFLTREEAEAALKKREEENTH